MDSYSKKYPLRNTSPPIPDATLGHGEYMFGSWYKYLIEDGNKVFFYNTKTNERTWSMPKHHIVDVYKTLFFIIHIYYVFLTIYILLLI